MSHSEPEDVYAELSEWIYTFNKFKDAPGVKEENKSETPYCLRHPSTIK